MSDAKAPVARLPSSGSRSWPLTAGIFLLYCLYLPFSACSAMVYDALGYWTLTERFFRAGSFHFLAYDDALRGYLLPLLNLPAKAVAHFTGAAPLTLTRLMGAAYAALLFGWAGPALWLRLFPRHRLDWLPRLAFAGLGFLFWRDYFNFVLSDFPAVLALVLSLWLVLGRGGPGAAVLAGAGLMAAANIRPVYLLAAPAVLLLSVLHVPGPRRLGQLGGLLLGAALLGGPQLLLNQRHHHVATPLVLSRDARLPTANLYLAQLGWGLVIQKYETSLDPAFPAPRMLYTDPAGQALLQRLHTRHFTSYAQYAAATRREPLAFVALYGRHLFNGLDVQYPSPFVTRITARSPWLAGLHYSVWFVALVVAAAGGRAVDGRSLLTVAALLLPCLAALPIAMECRFLLPLHLLLYAVACFGGAQWRPAWTALPWPRIALLMAGYAVFVLLCLRLSTQTQRQLTADVRVLAPLGGTEAQR